MWYILLVATVKNKSAFDVVLILHASSTGKVEEWFNVFHMYIKGMSVYTSVSQTSFRKIIAGVSYAAIAITIL